MLHPAILASFRVLQVGDAPNLADEGDASSLQEWSKCISPTEPKDFRAQKIMGWMMVDVEEVKHEYVKIWFIKLKIDIVACNFVNI